ncbi:MAG TPA: c-type cytochrome [Gammaproteobacteria bacterium]|nr:c-type cytochrome [Gammaproteobacteria bacterium]
MTPRTRMSRILKWGAASLLVAVAAIVAVMHVVHQRRLEYRLTAELPNSVPGDPAVMKYAVRIGEQVFQRNCAGCHGADLKGNTAIGAPNLVDGVWLYGDGSLFEIERTVLYGIRSTHSKSHNVTDMPAFGLRGVLSEAEIRSVIEYLLKLNGRPYQVEAANVGREVFTDKGNCGDCHGGDGRGDSYYGAPDLTVNVWNSGGSPDQLYKSLYFGVHHIMQAWIGTLSLVQIRAVSAYVYAMSQANGSSETVAAGSAKSAPETLAAESSR